jgi:hypothetical protein
MMSAIFLAVLGLVQAPPGAAGSAPDSYIVEDPFVIEEEPEMEAAPAAPTPGPAMADAEPPSPDRLICRSRPDLAARTRRIRVCMTAAQWQLHVVNMEQQRRDINDWGAQGGGPPR